MSSIVFLAMLAFLAVAFFMPSPTLLLGVYFASKLKPNQLLIFIAGAQGAIALLFFLISYLLIFINHLSPLLKLIVQLSYSLALCLIGIFLLYRKNDILPSHWKPSILLWSGFSFIAINPSNWISFLILLLGFQSESFSPLFDVLLKGGLTIVYFTLSFLFWVFIGRSFIDRIQAKSDGSTINTFMGHMFILFAIFLAFQALYGFLG